AAAVVALDRPDGQEAEAVGHGEALQLLRVRQVGHLGLLRVVVDAGQDRVALHRPQLGRRLTRVQAVQLVEQPARGTERRGAHVRGGPVVVVERHDVYDAYPGTV